MPHAFIVIAVLAVIAALIGGHLTSVKRRRELLAWSHSHSLRFDPSKDKGMDHRFVEFKCLCQGHSRYAHNICTGQWNGMEIAAFDYHYTTGSGKNRSNHEFSAVILKSNVPLKPMLIRREGFFDKVSGFFGFDDINFESAEFSRKFFVKSSDRRWAYDVIHQRMMEYLLSAPNFTIEFGLMHIIAHRASRFKPADFEAAAGLIRGVLDRLPDYVVQQQLGT